MKYRTNMEDISISLVTTLYHSEEYINDFYIRTKKVLTNLTNNYEIIFVNDGSPDNSNFVVDKIIQSNKSVHLLNLTRNFGHHAAILAGLERATKEIIILIDCDLEESPEDIPKLMEAFYKDTKVEMIFGVQSKRKGKPPERLLGSIYYSLLNLIRDSAIQKNQMTLRLMTRRYYEVLSRYTEKSFTLDQLFALVGLPSKPIELVKLSMSPSTYNYSRKMRLALTGLTTNSLKPLLYCSYIGMLFSILGFILGIYVIFRKIFFGALPGWASVTASIWIVGGASILCTSILGLYISQITIESKNRPRFVVESFK